MKVIMYTANIGNYDKDIPIQKLEYPFYRISVSNSKNPRLLAREIKLKPHEFLPDHDYSIWIDSNFEIINPVLDFSYDIVTWKHPDRDCIYEEAKECIRLKKDDPEIIFKQMHKYRSENYPEHNGLLASGFMIRKNTEQVNKFCEEWWDEVKHNSIRDQLSFNYVFTKYNLSLMLLNPFIGYKKYAHNNNK